MYIDAIVFNKTEQRGGKCFMSHLIQKLNGAGFTYCFERDPFWRN